MVGVLKSEIYEIECGKRMPGVYLVKRIARALS